MVGEAAPVAVIGAGAIGLTTALTLQEAGCHVTIYTAEPPLRTRSAFATGFWTPDSRLTMRRDEGFAARWEGWARTAYRRHLRFTGMAAMTARFELDDDAPSARLGPLERRLEELTPAPREVSTAELGLRARYAVRTQRLGFDIPGYVQAIRAQFEAAGGQLSIRRFRDRQELESLPQPIVVNAAGYGAKALFGDESLIPVRGQIAWMSRRHAPPVAISYQGITAYRRADTTLLQKRGGDGWGEGVDDETPSQEEYEEAFAIASKVLPS
nr:FAD-dependent oxidoreductase [Parvularcula maris]